jgi:DNA-binding response OmpR family regulator
MLTARTEETDRVVGLEMGADDYLTKPFSMRELLARVRALLRRAGPRTDDTDANTIRAGDIELDLRGRTLRRAGQDVQLKPKEFDLLFFMASNAGQVFTREQLLQQVWGYDFFGGSRTVDVHMRWLREKLEAVPGRPQHLLTVRGVGYKFVR